jgi:hypothetical protein
MNMFLRNVGNFTSRYGVTFQKTVIMLISLLCGTQVSQDEVREKLDVAPADFLRDGVNPMCTVSLIHTPLGLPSSYNPWIVISNESG